MRQLLAAIETTWAANATAAVVSPPAAAGPLYGINGPFWDRAPEKTAFPYCVFKQGSAAKLMETFGATKYLETVTIYFVVYASDATNGGLLKAAGYADSIAGVFDNNRMTLTSEVLVSAGRTVAPAMKKEVDYVMDAVPAYSGTLTYEYILARTR